MSGIFGLFPASPPIRRELLNQITASLSRRGPHAAFSWSDEEAAAGVCVFNSFSDTEPQTPPHDKNSGLIIVWDGRLDNREELNHELSLSSQAEVSDSSVVLAAFSRWGPQTPDRLRGDFAFGIWDPHNRRLFLARDVFGVRPLYYYYSPAGFFFASEIKALLEIPGIPKTPNSGAIASLLLGEMQKHGETFFQDIQQLPSATQLFWKRGENPVITRYWFPPTQSFSKKQDHESNFRGLFIQSLKRRMKTSFPVGSLFSGGLDSTQITYGAAWMRTKDPGVPPVLPLLWETPELLTEEQDAVFALKQIYDVSTMRLAREHAENERTNFEYYLEVGETPHLESFTTPHFLLEPFYRSGCRRVFMGVGANELGTYPETGHLADLLRNFRLISWNKELKRAAHSLRVSHRAAALWILKDTLRESLPFPARKLWRDYYLSKLSWVHENLRATIPKNPKKHANDYPTLSQEFCWRKLRDPWFSLSLNQIGEAGARAGLEMTYPFLDRDLVEYSLRVPGAVKIEKGYRKMFAQSALQPLVPLPHRATEQEDTAAHFSGLELSPAFQQERLKFYLSDSTLPIYTYVNYERIQAMLKTGFENFWQFHSILWRLVRLNFWLRNHFTFIS